MARHKQPEALAKLKGADKKNPQRYTRTPPKSDKKLGAPPAHLKPKVKEAWKELERYALNGVLTGADRLVMEITATLLAEFRANAAEMPAARIGHLVGCVARLGMTPADRQKLGVEKAKEGNPFDEF